MTRPNFLTSPGTWCRTPRRESSPIDDACAVHCVSKRDHAAGVVLAVMIGVALAVLLAWRL
jgi:hypothetical protein